MIKVVIERHLDQTFSLLEMEGHAGFDERGKDIVCAGVSAVVFGTLESIEKLSMVKLAPITNAKEGSLEVKFPVFFQRKADKLTVQTLLEGLLISLRKIEETYGQYIEVREYTDATTICSKD
jgi:uncharacterized protein